MMLLTEPVNNGHVCPDFAALVNMKTFVPPNSRRLLDVRGRGYLA